MIPGTPAPLTASDRTRLVSWLDGELGDALPEHAKLEQQLADWDALYLAEPPTARKQFPWDGAANIVLPLIGTTVDSVVARIVNTIFSVDPFWTVKPLHKDFVAMAGPTQDFLDWSRRVEFNLYTPVKRWTIQTVKCGWGWLKPRWDVSTQPYFTPLANGKAKREDLILRRPSVEHVLNGDIVTQVGIEDEAQAEWIAHRVRLTDGQLWWKQSDGIYPLSDDELETVIGQKEDVTPADPMLARPTDKLNTLYEMWIDFPLGKDKRPVSLVVTYHHQTKTILRAIYNPNFYGTRPFVKGTFIEREGRKGGLGIAAMLTPMQDAISTNMCQQIDNATLANTRFFLGKRGQIRPGTKIWPGRVLNVGDPERDLKAFQLGDTYPSTRGLEQSIQQHAERRSGVSDPQLGREASGSSRATATGTLALIQEGNRRFDLNVRDMRDALSEVGKQVLQLNQQFRPKGLAYFVQGEDGKLTEATLDLPSGYIEHRLGVELTASTATINREVEKQGLIALSQQQQAYGQELLTYAQIAGNEQLPGAMRETAAKVAQTRYEMMVRLAAAFEQKDAENIIPALEAMDGQGLGALYTGGAGPADPSAVGAPGLPAPLPSDGGAAGNGGAPPPGLDVMGPIQ